LRLFWLLYLKLGGWKAVNEFPHYIKKAVIIVGPHTSWKDFPVSVAFRNVLKIKHGKYLGKQELFNGPFGFLFLWAGGTPVDRFSKHGVVDQVVEKFNSSENLLIALSPEGTRKKVDKLRTGFYHIAKKAHVPIIMIGLDYNKKEFSISEPFNPSEDETADFKKIISFFAPIKGAKPDQGLGHFLNENLS